MPKYPAAAIPMITSALAPAPAPEEPGPRAQQNPEQSPSDQAPERYIPPPRSPSSVRRIRIKNRRRRYLERHPSYFEGESGGHVDKDAAAKEQRTIGTVGMEAVDPLLYDRLVRRFQTDEERTAARRNKGFAATLSADLSRAEARLASVSSNKSHDNFVNGQVISDNEKVHTGTTTDTADIGVDTGMKPFLIEPDSPKTRAEGLEQWRAVLTHRFVAGLDSDFDYTTVDNDDGESSSWIGQDEEDEKERQERWFEEGDEDEEEADNEIEDEDEDFNEKGDGVDAGQSKSEHEHGKRKRGGKRKVILTGERGIQDF